MAEPIKNFRAGAVSAGVFENTIKTKEGKDAKIVSVQIRRAYKDKDDTWQHTDNYREGDLPLVILVSNKAFEWIKLEYKREE